MQWILAKRWDTFRPACDKRFVRNMTWYEQSMKTPISLPKFFVLMLLLVTLVAASGCANHSGSREFIPGKGWVPND